MEQKEKKLRLVGNVTPLPEQKDSKRTKPATQRIPVRRGTGPRPGGDAA